MSQDFPIRYSPRLSWLFTTVLLGHKHADVRLTSTELQVRMGWAFDARIPRSSIRTAKHHRDVWWAIGVHTDLRGSWLVNGSATGIVELTIDPPVRAARTAHAIVTFTILRDGTVKNIRLSQSSGNRSMDDSGMRALFGIDKMPALPSDWRGQSVDVTFDFDLSQHH